MARRISTGPQRFIINYSWDHSVRQAQWSRRQIALRLEPLRCDHHSGRHAHDLRRTAAPARLTARKEPAPHPVSAARNSAPERPMATSRPRAASNPAWEDTAAVRATSTPSAFCAAPAIMPDGVTVTTQAACPTCATLFGNSGMGILLGPGQFNFDMLDSEDHQDHRTEHSPVPRGVLQPAQPSAVQPIWLRVQEPAVRCVTAAAS